MYYSGIGLLYMWLCHCYTGGLGGDSDNDCRINPSFSSYPDMNTIMIIADGEAAVLTKVISC